MLRLALAPGLAPGRDLPRTLFANQLEHLDKAAWLGLANALVVNDRQGAHSPGPLAVEQMSS